MSKQNDSREIKTTNETFCEVPILDYKPSLPKTFIPKIGLIGCGGIANTHLQAYKEVGWDVVALSDIDLDAAKEKQKSFYPEAKLYSDYAELLKEDVINVVDIALHPEPRVKAVEAALHAKKHVLSQKPFSLNIEDGKKLARLADEKRRKLAVNQNGRWAPYVSFARQAINSGLLGEVQSVNININWDHSGVKGSAFEDIHHLILYDFAIHWFDMTQQFFRDQKALNVFASTAYSKTQDIRPPLIANAAIQYENGVANLCFEAHSLFHKKEMLTITGSKGTYRAMGNVCNCSDITLVTDEGICHPQLEGKWFSDGFAGTMGELLCAIEEDRKPSNSAWNNLKSLEICFAALRSADSKTNISLSS